VDGCDGGIEVVEVVKEGSCLMPRLGALFLSRLGPDICQPRMQSPMFCAKMNDPLPESEKVNLAMAGPCRRKGVMMRRKSDEATASSTSK
jgi:hypothetical protein